MTNVDLQAEHSENDLRTVLSVAMVPDIENPNSREKIRFERGGYVVLDQAHGDYDDNLVGFGGTIQSLFYYPGQTTREKKREVFAKVKLDGGGQTIWPAKNLVQGIDAICRKAGRLKEQQAVCPKCERWCWFREYNDKWICQACMEPRYLARYKIREVI